MADEPILATDSYGRQVPVPREHWRTVILPGQLQQHWSNPDQLSRVILGALADDLGEEVREASAHLLSIDRDVERSHLIRAQVLRQLGNRPATSQILEKALKDVGETPKLLLELARLQEGRDIKKARETLWRSLQGDPNDAAALDWWTRLRIEEKGESVRQEVLREVGELAGSWLAPLRSAAEKLQRGDIADALRLHESVLTQIGTASPEAVAKIAADLSLHGQPAALVRWIAPRHDAGCGDAQVGLYLIQAYLALGRLDEANQLIESLYRRGEPVLSQALRSHSADLDRQRANTFPQGTTPTAREPLEIGVMPFDRPPWLLGGADLAWAADPAPRTLKVALLVPSTANQEQWGNQPERIDADLGSVGRAVTLAMLELFYFTSAFAAQALIPIADRKHLIHFAGEETTEQLLGIGQQFDYIVRGTIAPSGGDARVTLHLLRGADAQEIEHWDAVIAIGQTDPFSLAESVVASLSSQTDKQRRTPAYYVVPSGEYLPPYCTAMTQTLALTLLWEKKDREFMPNARDVLFWLQGLALAMPHNDAAQFMFFIGLLKLKRIESPVVAEFERFALSRLRDLRSDNCYSARLAPVVHAVFDQRNEFEWAATGDHAFEPHYATWCDNLAANILRSAQG